TSQTPPWPADRMQVQHIHTHTSRLRTPDRPRPSKAKPQQRPASIRAVPSASRDATEPDSQSSKNTKNPNQRLRSGLEPRSKPNPTLAEPPPLNPGPCHGDGRVRTDDPLLAKQVLSQLSYAPSFSHQQPAISRPPTAAC